MPAERIRDLPAPVMAAKADWLIASHWIGFTPTGQGPDAVQQCQATISRQMRNGYVLEYVTQTIDEPNGEYRSDPQYLEDKAAHAEGAGRLVAVHKLRASPLPLRKIVGDAEYEKIQNMWDEGGDRRRWSVAFPIIESYDITSRPLARDALGQEAMRRLFAHASATLRPLTDEERSLIADLPIAPRKTENAWIGILGDIERAERSEIDPRVRREIERDLPLVAIEGMTSEQWVKVRLRAAWLADTFARDRKRAGRLHCDDCGFDPATRVAGTSINPRSLLDVHHLHPLEEGRRVTTSADLQLLCPTCHRFAHSLLRMSASP